MQTYGVKTLSVWIDVPVDDIGCEHMTRIWVRVAEEVGKGDSGEGVVVGEFVLEELHDDVQFMEMNSSGKESDPALFAKAKEARSGDG